MWKNNKESAKFEEAIPTPTPPPIQAEKRTEAAIIGPSISVKGEISGAEDLQIQGFIDGTVNLKQNVVTIGKSGRVQANVYGRIIHVEGEVGGDLFGTEQVVVHKSGQVRGNISAPRVTLEDGARLKGAIDTNPASTEIEATSGRGEPSRSTSEGRSEGKRSKDSGAQAASIQ